MSKQNSVDIKIWERNQQKSRDYVYVERVNDQQSLTEDPNECIKHLSDKINKNRVDTSFGLIS